jgi:hypothetical protein
MNQKKKIKGSTYLAAAHQVEAQQVSPNTILDLDRRGRRLPWDAKQLGGSGDVVRPHCRTKIAAATLPRL